MGPGHPAHCPEHRWPPRGPCSWSWKNCSSSAGEREASEKHRPCLPDGGGDLATKSCRMPPPPQLTQDCPSRRQERLQPLVMEGQASRPSGLPGQPLPFSAGWWPQVCVTPLLPCVPGASASTRKWGYWPIHTRPHPPHPECPEHSLTASLHTPKDEQLT